MKQADKVVSLRKKDADVIAEFLSRVVPRGDQDRQRLEKALHLLGFRH